MCGRIACISTPDEICQACSRQSTPAGLIVPKWVDHPGRKNFIPSPNIAPSSYTPILFRVPVKSGNKRNREGNAIFHQDNDYSIMPMRWGLIPSFFKGASTSEFKFKTNNCRIEGIEEKKLFKPSLVKGKRCVVLCDGFYEWRMNQNTNEKQPYFVHAPQPTGMDIWNKAAVPKITMWSDKGCNGPRLLMMAGLYSNWHSSQDEEVYSYTVITMKSGNDFSWLHDRVPAILDTFEDVDNWLGNGEYEEKLSSLANLSCIYCYQVSQSVNNSRNQDLSLMNPLDNQKSMEVKTAGHKLTLSGIKKASENK